MTAGNNKPYRRRTTCPVPKSTFTSYMDEGSMHYRAGRYRKALFCYDRAIELQPDNQNSLVARSQCHLKLGNGEAALQDAKSASDDGNFSFAKGLLQYAEALYNMSLFEKALIAYHHGNRVRRDMDEFRIGILKCQDAIRVTIGNPAATQIEDLEEILPLMKEIEEMENRKDPHCCIRPGSDEYEGKDRIKLPKPSKARSRWVAREVLGKMYFDKKYLVKILKRSDVQGESLEAAKLRSCATEALNYLEIREKFWRLQNPMYARKPGLNFNNNMVLAYEQEELQNQEEKRKIKMDAAEGAVLSNIAQIDHALKIGRGNDAQLACERSIRQMKDMSTNLLPRKPEFMCHVLHSKGIALEKMKKYDKAIQAFNQEVQVATDFHQPDAKNNALDCLGRCYALKLAYNEAAEMWETRLSFAKNPMERSYLLHEIGRCYLELEKYDIASYYAKQSFQEAVRSGDVTWKMNAKILSGQIDLKTTNFDSAQANFMAAEEVATDSGNIVNSKLLHDALQCLKVLIEKRNRGTLATKPSKKSMMSIK